MRVNNLNGTITASQENVQPSSKSTGIIAIVPPGSPEINNSAWPGKNNQIFTDGYPAINPTEYWWSSIQQTMTDRYYTATQDTQTSNGSGGCTPIIPPPTVPKVEARLTAPTGAPFDFSGGDGNAYQKLPPPTDFTFGCDAVWQLSAQFSTLPYDNWPGMNTSSANATGDQYSTGQTSDAMNSGLGTG